MEYCPNCNALRVTLELSEQGDVEERCAACGFPFREAPRLEQPGPPLCGEKVLCIDDDPLVLHLLAGILQKSGLVPLTAPDGPTGLTLAAAERPRLIIVDVMMPGLDGFEVCRRLRADPRTAAIPLVILTAGTDPKLNVKAFKAGADLALSKHLTSDTLIATLRAALVLKKANPATGETRGGGA